MSAVSGRKMIDVTRLSGADVEAASVIYGVGDIHGRLDLLDEMEAAIATDIAASAAERPLICYVGDYIDRGPNSAQVLDRLCSYSLDAPPRVFLKGNHEDRMIKFFAEPAENGPEWQQFGGREALQSYGVAAPDKGADADWPKLRDQFAAALPESHRSFLKRLRFGLRWQNYILVHAGLNPRRSITEQAPDDLMWIREPFLSSDRDWGFKVVHGHVAADEPVFRANRICIDTGAYQTGRLTCIVLDGAGERLIQTRAP